MVELLNALRGGMIHAAVMQGVPRSADPSQVRPSSPAEVQSVLSTRSTQLGNLPLYRRAWRRLLQLVRPLALPFLLRFKRWVSLGVDESRSAQLLQQLLARQDDISARLDRIATEVQSLRAAFQQVRDRVHELEPPAKRLASEQHSSDNDIDALRQVT